ncbi:MAG: hypothetical protein ACK4K4_01505, partial [Caldimicrobium sp.]
TPYYSYWLELIQLKHSILFTFLFFFFSLTLIGLTKLSALIFKYTEDPLFGKFNLSVALLVPFAFTGELIYRLQYFLKNLGEFLPTLGRQFNYPELLKYQIKVPTLFIKNLSLLLLTLALIGSLYLIFYFYYKDFEKEIPFKKYLHFILLSLLLYFCYYFLIFISI